MNRTAEHEVIPGENGNGRLQAGQPYPQMTLKLAFPSDNGEAQGMYPFVLLLRS